MDKIVARNLKTVRIYAQDPRYTELVQKINGYGYGYDPSNWKKSFSGWERRGRKGENCWCSSFRSNPKRKKEDQGGEEETAVSKQLFFFFSLSLSSFFFLFIYKN